MNFVLVFHRTVTFPVSWVSDLDNVAVMIQSLDSGARRPGLTFQPPLLRSIALSKILTISGFFPPPVKWG